MSTDTSSTANLAQAYNKAFRQLRWAEQPEPPPVEKIRAYIAQLAPLYLDILKAFQDAYPPRAEGESVAFPTIRNHLLNEGKSYTEPELGLAIDKLVEHEIVTEAGPLARLWYAPTKLGEALIREITGQATVKVQVPELPTRTW